MHGAQEHTPNPDDLEKRIKSEVCRVVANASNWPDPIAAQMLGRDLAEPISKIVEAITPLIREAKAESLTEAATEIDRLESIGDTARNQVSEDQEKDYWRFHGTPITDWLRDRANQYKEAPSA